MTGRSDPFRFLAGRPSLIAPLLLGAELVVAGADGERRGRIVEVEAYEGRSDPASHAHGAVTERNRIMHGPVGRLYVYRSYGIHWCANVVAHEPGAGPGAILIRAVEPLVGLEAMWRDRPKARRETDLGSGPGKACAALSITDADNGADLLASESRVRLEVGSPVAPADVAVGVRVGITKAVDRPWRFALTGNPHVSRPVPAAGRQR